MPEEATASAISPLARTAFSRQFALNVFPVPPGASMKSQSPVLLSIAASAASTGAH